ncbi:hypothetical protein pEaSNUABM56_00035 [Erwinia phage pEa_SNUABM_56]|nr:hypothetical protein pEaSNUABM55_00239 [Erwinia phage pEa_SNUABM_55]UYL85080.1 hypothetical protein pEaSNUABM56_00035 [Erwinia phage pEa_SNUABM_56]
MSAMGKKVTPYLVHPFDPKNKAVIHRRWVEKRMTKCPVPQAQKYNKEYTAEYVEYTYINGKGKPVHVEEFILWIKWE